MNKIWDFLKKKKNVPSVKVKQFPKIYNSPKEIKRRESECFTTKTDNVYYSLTLENTQIKKTNLRIILKDETVKYYLLSRLDLKFKYNAFGQVLSNSLSTICVTHIYNEFFILLNCLENLPLNKKIKGPILEDAIK